MDNPIVHLIKIKGKQFSEWTYNQAKSNWLKFSIIFIGIIIVAIAVYFIWNNFFNQEERARKEGEENNSFIAKISEGIQGVFVDMFNPSDGNLIAELQVSDNKARDEKKEPKPFVFVDKTSVYPKETLIKSGSGFTPKGKVSLLFSSPSGRVVSNSILADENGQFNHNHIINASAEIGVHYYWAKDTTTNFITDKVKFLIISTSEQRLSLEEIKKAENQKKEETKETNKNLQLDLPKKCFFAGEGLVNTKRVVLNEVAWMGSTTNHNNEWIELKNISSSSIDISGWWLIDQAEQIRVVFPSNTIVPAGRFYLLERSDDESAPNVRADMIYNGILSNSKEGIRLFNSECLIEDEVLANPDWPAGDSADRRTMERKIDLSDWRTSSFVDGTPKQENSVGIITQANTSPLAGRGNEGESGNAPTPPQPVFCSKESLSSPAHSSVIFNEVAWMGSGPNPGETVGQSANNEWIELKNISGQDINLAGWQILDKDNQIRVAFIEEHRINNANNWLFLLERTDDNSAPGATANLIYAGGLSNSNEALYLFNAKCELQDKILANPDWPAGDNASKRTMERRLDLSWQTSANSGGTPKQGNSVGIIIQAGAIVQAGLVAQTTVTASTSSPDPPRINLSYQPQNPVDKEIIVSLSLSNFKNANYDVKISIEADKTISEIFNKKENKWQSSFHYLNSFSSEASFSTPQNFRLRIKDKDKYFRGEADIIAKIRESEKKEIFLEFKGKISITDAEQIASIPHQSQNQNQSPEQPKQENPKTASTNSLLSNGFFKNWDDPANSAVHLHNWSYNGTASHIIRAKDTFVGNYFAQWTPITTAFNLTQTDVAITKAETYYARIWIKPLNVDNNNYIRVALDIADPIDGNFPRANFVDYKSEDNWVKLTQIRDIGIGENGGIRIRAQRSGAPGPSLLIGATWLGIGEPPSDWLFQN